MTNYAHIADRSAFLFTEFGEQLARKWFGDKIVDDLPKYVRGKKKGKPKGVITWSKIERGGWVRGYDYEDGYVETRVGHIFDRKIHHAESTRYGTAIGDLVMDLDREIELKKTRERHIQEWDIESREYEKKRSFYELVICGWGGLTGEQLEAVSGILQQNIADLTADIQAIHENIAETKKKLEES